MDGYKVLQVYEDDWGEHEEINPSFRFLTPTYTTEVEFHDVYFLTKYKAVAGKRFDVIDKKIHYNPEGEYLEQKDVEISQDEISLEFLSKEIARFGKTSDIKNYKEKISIEDLKDKGIYRIKVFYDKEMVFVTEENLPKLVKELNDDEYYTRIDEDEKTLRFGLFYG